MTYLDTVKLLSEKLDTQSPVLRRLDAYWAGSQPAAYLAKKSKDALQGSIRQLAVNFPRLAVESLVERLNVTGFRLGDAEEADAALWREWTRNGLEDMAPEVHTDALVYGRSYVLVWADASGRPSVSVESPLQVSMDFDPATRQPRAAMKRWRDGNVSHAVLYLPEKVLHYVHKSWAGDGFPSTGWELSESLNNPFGVLPVVPFINRSRLSELEGVSEMDDLLDLTDALNKVTADALVTSEFYARPRRWATGLELEEDEDGNAINPFTNEEGRMWTSEDPATKFGQFDAQGVTGYTELMATFTQMIGALSSLPPHYLGLNGDQPPSADSIRSAEASLVSRAGALQRTFGRSWALVAALMHAVMTQADPLSVQVGTLWASAETRTPAQQTDAAHKLVDMGVPLTVALSKGLDWSPEEVRGVRKALRADALDRMAVDLEDMLRRPSAAVEAPAEEVPAT